VARDRQRAKQRRAQRRAAGGRDASGRGTGENRGRDAFGRSSGEGGRDALGRSPADEGGRDALGRSSADEGGRDALSRTPADEGGRDAFGRPSAEVEEARLAEAGALEDDDGGAEIYADELEDDRVERAPDAVEGDAVSRRDLLHAEEPRRKRGRVITFLGHCIDELRRVQWPNRRQVGQATAVVLGFVVIAGGYLGLLDSLWKPLIEAIL
jgi:preprotein translocase SecE subunit